MGILRLISDALTLLSPVLLNRLLNALTRKSVDSALIWSLVFVAELILKSFLSAHYSFQQGKQVARMKSALMGALFLRELDGRHGCPMEHHHGRTTTLFSVDTDKAVGIAIGLYDLISLPVQILVALLLLYTQVHFAFIGGLAVVIALVPINRYLAKKIQTTTLSVMSAKDKRISSILDVIHGIRQIKVYGWEPAFLKRIQRVRQEELAALAIRKYLDAVCVFFWATTSLLLNLATFAAFTLHGSGTAHLTPEVVFTSIALFGILLGPINAFPWVVNGMVEAVVSMGRLKEYLLFLNESPAPASDSSPTARVSVRKNGEIVISKGSLFCATHGVHMRVSETLRMPKGSFIVITGPLGCGKSSMLHSLCEHFDVTTALVTQPPFLYGKSMRKNILFGSDTSSSSSSPHTTRFCTALYQAGLTEHIAAFGARGCKLSGGQKARVALARALYHSKDVYLLDDVLSSVDSHMAEHILVQGILRGPIEEGRTVLLVSEHPRALHHAHGVIHIDTGGTIGPIQWQERHPMGEYGNHCEDTALLQNLQGIEELKECEEEDDEEGEARAYGYIDLAVYASYLRASGATLTVIILSSLLLMQATKIVSDYWLAHWASWSSLRGEADSKYNLYCLQILAIITALHAVITLIRAFSFAKGGLNAAQSLHNHLLRSVLTLPPQFYDSTVAGEMVNRFSSDTASVDDSLPFILNIFLANAVGLAGTIGVIAYAQPLSLCIIVPAGYVFYSQQSWYRHTSRELKRLEATFRSPVYSLFNDIIDGGSTIDAFDCKDYFLDKSQERIGRQLRVTLTSLAASAWLALRLQLMAALIAGMVAALAVIQLNGSGHTPVLVGLTGLGLSYALPVTSLLNGLLTSGAETEQEAVSIERILVYSNLPPEPNFVSLKPMKLLGSGPLEVVYEDVTLEYGSHTALRHVSVKIASGSALGIVGRTGAGKSSLVSALVRMTPQLTGGRVLVGGIDIASLPLRTLRTAVGVVPQSPFVFHGTLRDNVDPSKKYSDEEICCALDKVALPVDLLHRNIVGGRSLSQGQKQLIALARVLLAQPRIMILDECSASIDPHTFETLKDIVQKEIQGRATVLEVAHRMVGVVIWNQTIVMDSGQVVQLRRQ